MRIKRLPPFSPGPISLLKGKHNHWGDQQPWANGGFLFIALLNWSIGSLSWSCHIPSFLSFILLCFILFCWSFPRKLMEIIFMNPYLAKSLFYSPTLLCSGLTIGASPWGMLSLGSHRHAIESVKEDSGEREREYEHAGALKYHVACVWSLPAQPSCQMHAAKWVIQADLLVKHPVEFCPNSWITGSREIINQHFKSLQFGGICSRAS